MAPPREPAAAAPPAAAGSPPPAPARPEPPVVAAPPSPAAQQPEARPERSGTVPTDTLSWGAVMLRGPETVEIDMRPVKSFADLARVTKLLGRVAPGAQPVDLNLPQHRALFSIKDRDKQSLAAQLQGELPEAKVVQRDGGIDVLLEGE